MNIVVKFLCKQLKMNKGNYIVTRLDRGIHTTSMLNSSKKYKKKGLFYDYWLLGITGTLLAIGLLMVASASMVISDRIYHTPFHFFFHQLSYISIGISLGWVILRIPLDFWQDIGHYLLIISLFLLMVVLIPGIGREVNGSTRWLGLGPFGMQVSELAKFSIIIFLSGYLVRRQHEVRTNFKGFVKPIFILGAVGILLLLEPDFGAATVILFTALSVIFLAGARLRQFIILMLLVVAGLACLAVTSPYRMLRLTTFLHPWANPFDSGYQLTQSLIAFGRGGIFGVGLGNSIQKLFYLPEAHTDFLFAVLVEELGLIGGLTVILLFAILVGRILIIGRKAHKKGKLFAAYVTYGLGLWIGFQAMINIGVNAGLLPTKGLTLPFISYGGSSMLFYCVAIAVLLRIYYEVSLD
jgi:cell division protein FtsW